MLNLYMIHLVSLPYLKSAGISKKTRYANYILINIYRFFSKNIKSRMPAGYPAFYSGF